MPIPEHSIRFGKSGEKKVLEIHQDTFEAVVINANSLAHFGKSLSTFIVINQKGKGFFIDPQTHAFQHPLDKISNDKGKIKTSVEKIINFYGEPLKKVIFSEERPLKPGDFSDNEERRNFVKKVLEFQKNHLFNSLEDDFKQYLEDEEFKSMIPSSSPLVLVPPYFYISGSISSESNEKKVKLNREFVELNREFIEISKETSDRTDQIFGELVIDKELFKAIAEETKTFEKISETYREADGILFWIDDLDEHNSEGNYLEFLIRFIKKIKKNFPDKKLINLYGSYFSQMMLKIGLNGVVHGPEYGEYRAVVPVGGGIPIAKYYYPEIRKRIPSNEVLWLLKSQRIDTPQKFFKEVCGCRVCRHLIKGNVIEDFIENYGKSHPVEIKRGANIYLREFPETETVEHCLSHYLEVKKKEFEEIKKKELPQLLERLNESFKKFKDQIWIEEKEIIHLKKWHDALQNGL